MSHQPAGERQQLDPVTADAVRAYAARKRAAADKLAAVLEDIAANGLPALEDCTPWEEIRDRKLADLLR
ncbi:hypothetical protein [Streptomyces sp. MST-110588]|uniref:hypothetical protein n=1 Tax=Streptomyces sp. MST-110588 TaxID=2833628 RepID=UPI001F5DABB2|nr:hypothetical protein [Streptomyces sp. MST-110588]UNO43478.1 hypothetical protein KGS77_33370 [Streptomyces sp. MST-110588]